MIIDSHCHYDEVIKYQHKFHVIIPAINLDDIIKLKDYQENINNHAKIGCGIHPWYLNDDINKLEEYIIKYNPDFIGETGLDKNKPNFEQQITYFKHHLELANKYQKPIIIHCVNAYNELLNLTKPYPELIKICHAFNANLTIATQLINKNFYLGIGSIITYPQTKLTKIITSLPISKLLIESDAPYMKAKNKPTASITDCEIYLNKLSELLNIDKNILSMQINTTLSKTFNL